MTNNFRNYDELYSSDDCDTESHRMTYYNILNDRHRMTQLMSSDNLATPNPPWVSVMVIYDFDHMNSYLGLATFGYQFFTYK